MWLVLFVELLQHEPQAGNTATQNVPKWVSALAARMRSLRLYRQTVQIMKKIITRSAVTTAPAITPRDAVWVSDAVICEDCGLAVVFVGLAFLLAAILEICILEVATTRLL